MKKILFLLMATALLAAEPYIGLAGSLSQWTQQDDHIVDCRIGVNAIGGIEVVDGLAFESRYVYGMSKDYSSIGAYVKPYFGPVYLLVGWGKTYYDKVDDESGLRYGIGYELKREGKVPLFVDVIRKADEDDYLLTIGFRYEFN